VPWREEIKTIILEEIDNNNYRQKHIVPWWKNDNNNIAGNT